jgi:hypothetical protein
VFLPAAFVDGSFEVAAAVAWQHMVIDDSSILMWAEVEDGTLTILTQVNNKARSYTWLVCRDHGPWWYDPLAQCFRIGGTKYVCFRVCEQVPIGVEQLKAYTSNSSCLYAQELLERSYAKLGVDEDYAKALQA